MRPWDVAIIGGGILGTTAAYWLAARYDARIAVLEQDEDVALHASGRNTGVIHRPFYLHPRRSRRFARSALLSFALWRDYATQRGLPWVPVGTLKLALRPEDLPVLETYATWAAENGLEEEEIELLDRRQLQDLEPRVEGAGALHAKEETAVDFGAFTHQLREEAAEAGVHFLTGRRVADLVPGPHGLILTLTGDERPHEAWFVLNCGGGGAVPLAHGLGVGTTYADLHFRGEYWRVAEWADHLAQRNVYPLPRFPEFPFLDPHWILRAGGGVEIGPTAVPVAGPWIYTGFTDGLGMAANRFFAEPLRNKARLARNPTFLRLALGEAVGGLSRAWMTNRVRRFLPSLPERALRERGTAGVRSAVIDIAGQFVREVIELEGPASVHVLNYNSPGATGAPAYTASLLDRLEAQGHLDHLGRRRTPRKIPWDYEATVAGFDASTS